MIELSPERLEAREQWRERIRQAMLRQVVDVNHI